MDFREYLKKENKIILDGGTGTMLQSLGYGNVKHPETLTVTNPDVIISLHKAYFDAGSNIVATDTFGANPLKFSDDELENIISNALKCARKAAELSENKGEKFVALDIGPLGRMLSPIGDIGFEEAVKMFSQVAKLGEKHGADLVMIETMNDLYETKAALLAVKESTSLPVFVSNAYSENGRLMTGADPVTVISVLEGLGADAVGVNCSFGPDGLAPIIEKYLVYAHVPVTVKPNAGLPEVVDGKTVFNVGADEFSDKVSAFVADGVRIFGGCCGTTPEYISKVKAATENIIPKKTTPSDAVFVTSSVKAVEISSLSPVIIGERINPTGKKALKNAITEGDTDYILGEAVKQETAGADIIDVNVGVPGTDEAVNLENAVKNIQTVTDLPLQIDTADTLALERALRIYNGKALINSVNGKKSSMDFVFPLVKKYGGAVVALLLDENGIPDTVEGRLEIAERISDEAGKYGITELVFDALTMPVSAGANNGVVTLETLKKLTEKGYKTVLGVSNISYGLPARDNVTAAFLSSAIYNGLSAAIINPCSETVKGAFVSSAAVCGKDENCGKYISAFAESKKTEAVTDTEITLSDSILHGFREKASSLTEKLLETKLPTDIISEEIIPALDKVGREYESGRAFLPELLICAETASCAFDVIKRKSLKPSESKKGSIVIATVQGDIHDIGKNIVKLLLENYGFFVTDLGKDVPPRTVVDAVKKHNASVVGLSALMTTTLPSMEATIKLLKEECPDVKTVVGGAVLTKEYAEKIGADFYAHDAMDTVRFAEKYVKV